ncbi:unnamed protein product, partial [Amoebophrya sp. A120]
ATSSVNPAISELLFLPMVQKIKEQLYITEARKYWLPGDKNPMDALTKPKKRTQKTTAILMEILKTGRIHP